MHICHFITQSLALLNLTYLKRKRFYQTLFIFIPYMPQLFGLVRKNSLFVYDKGKNLTRDALGN